MTQARSRVTQYKSYDLFFSGGHNSSTQEIHRSTHPHIHRNFNTSHHIMSKILAVFGATGHQGSSIIDHVLNHSELSQQYTLRAITRDSTSSKASLLHKKNIEVVSADVTDAASLARALTNAHTVFIMTVPSFGTTALETEYEQAKAIADVSVQQGAQYLIFSTLPSVSAISKGKYTVLTPFDAKAKAERYIRSLPIKTAFYCPGSFMENFLSPSALMPRRTESGKWELTRHVSPETQFPLIDATSDTGKFVGPILTDPERFVGATICAATSLYSLNDIVGVMSKLTGETITYRQVSLEESNRCLPDALAGFPQVINELLGYLDEFGYYGPGTREKVASAVEQAAGDLTSFEEFLRVHNSILTE